MQKNSHVYEGVCQCFDDEVVLWCIILLKLFNYGFFCLWLLRIKTLVGLHVLGN